MIAEYYDTGILLKLYTPERESKRVRDFVVGRGRAIRITDLHVCEAVSAFRLNEFRGECTTQQATEAIAAIEEDIRARTLRLATLDWPSAWMRCQMLAQSFAGRTGVRTLDTLHVACALTLRVGEFIASDRRQLALARASGLKATNPLAR